MKAPAIKFTYQDYLQLPEDRNRYEIIDGEIYMTPSPVPLHQRISRNLEMILHQHVKKHCLGEILYAPCDVILSETDVIVPDILFISKARSSIVQEKNIQGAPDLIVEILSPSTTERDRGIKKKLYAKYKVPEYWIVDPDATAIEISRLEKTGYQLHDLFRGKAVVTSPTFPDLKFTASEIFE